MLDLVQRPALRLHACCAAQDGQSYKDPNIAAHHFHGHYGNPGTDNVPCDPPPAAGNACYRGDNIFAEIDPGQCNEYQYDISPVTAPGTFWCATPMQIFTPIISALLGLVWTGLV